jgi:hypothetical protein
VPANHAEEGPMRKENLDEDDIFLIHDFLSPQECDSFIARSEQAGYADAPLTTADGPVINKGVRDNRRLMVDDPDLARSLYERARPFLPAVVERRWEVSSFNERWRYYRYDPGERFALHYDGHVQRSEDEVSQLTFMIYLKDFEGGQTNFYFLPAGSWFVLSAEPSLSVKPERGAALVFIHRRLHEGAPVVAGRKYVLRTDVLCRRRPPA